MSVEDRAKELNFLAEKIKDSFTNFNSQFKSISQKRIRLKRNIAERKERDVKLKASSSSFGKSVDSVKSKVVSGPSNILGKVLGFASLLLFGVTLANIFKVDKKLDTETEAIKEKSDNTGNFITGMVNGVKGFISGFGGMYKKVDKIFDGVDDSLKDAQGELSKFEGETGGLDNFDLKKILTNSKADDDDDDEEETEDDGVDRVFKKQSVNSLQSDQSTEKNAQKTAEELDKQGIELRKKRKLRPDEQSRIDKAENFLDVLDDRKIDISKFNVSPVKDTFEIDGQMYTGDIIIINKTLVEQE
tara:strand:- start:238 stop:1143 length:906 start_codon:yes stop_codon:yes gene_type:complete